MFNSNHYVPILKWKRAEQKALADLKPESRSFITPFIQLVMPKAKITRQNGQVVTKSPDEQFDEVILKFKASALDITDSILKSWGKEPIFVDFSLLYTDPLKIECSEIILEKSKTLGARFIPVINISDSETLKSYIYSFAKTSGNGMCIRLVCSDLLDKKKLSEEIGLIIEQSALPVNMIDIFVDIQDIYDDPEKYIHNSRLSQNIPFLIDWRTFTLASGAFPENLSAFRIDEENLIPRLDWLNWKDQYNSEGLFRTPAFADYTIQHPIFKYSYQFFAPTTSIKYTSESSWVLAKGKKHQFELYLINAKGIVDDECFMGEAFSQGDKYIYDKAKHFDELQKNPALKKETGNSELWIRASINHHLEYTAAQISSLV